MSNYRQRLLANIGITTPEAHLRPAAWPTISASSRLNEVFICEFANKLDWLVVSRCQPMSNGLIHKFKDRIDWRVYFTYNMADFSIMKQFVFKSNLCSIEQLKTSHLSDVEKQEIQRLLELKFMF